MDQLDRKCGWLRRALVQPIRRLVALVAVLLVPMSGATGQQRAFLRFERISTEQGLSQFSVRCILQDRQGFMWFGTQDGLNKYDGYTFTVFTHDPDDPESLSDTNIVSLFEDSDGMLWVGTLGGGLNRFDPRQETCERFKHDDEDPGSLSDNGVLAIHQDSAGTLWVGTTRGLNRFEPSSATFAHYRADHRDPSGLSHDQVLEIVEDSSGSLWIGTREGLDRYDPVSEGFVHYRKGDDPSKLSDDHIRAVVEDSNGMLWVGTARGGLNRLDPQTGIFKRFRHDDYDPTSLGYDAIETLFEDSTGVLWVGTWGGGLSRYDPRTETFEHIRHDQGDSTSLGDDDVASIYEDSSGLLWFGTWDGGVSRFDPRTESFAQIRRDDQDPSSLSHDHVMSIVEDPEGALWFATAGGGLNRYDPETGQIVRYQHNESDPASLRHDEVYALHTTSSGGLWVGTVAGLDWFDPRSETFSRIDQEGQVFALEEDSAGRLWIAIWGGGVSRYDPRDGRITVFQHERQNPTSLSHDDVQTVFEDASGTIWVGTWGGGLDRFDPETGAFDVFRHDEQDPFSLSHDRVSCFLETAEGGLWVGTSGGGVNLVFGEGDRLRFERLTTQDGLASDSIGGMLEDSAGRLWISTTQGISRLDPDTRAVKNFFGEDGVQDAGYWIGSALMDHQGRIYFGGTRGVTWFRPDDIEDDTEPPTVVLTRFLLFNREVRAGEPGSPLAVPIGDCNEIVLEHQQYLFSIDFAALHYAQPDAISYAYTMEGLDTEWVLTGARNRRATYTKLSAGDYTFRVKACNRDGYWNEEGRSLRITVLPPLWRTWWAYCLYCVAFVVLGTSLVMVRERSLRRKARELQRLIDERTEQLRRNVLELETLDQIVEAINRTVDLRQVMEACLQHGQELLPQAYGGVFLGREPGGDTFRVVASTGWDPEDALGMTYDVEEAFQRYRAEPASDGVFVIRDARTRPGAAKVAHLSTSNSLVSIELKVDDEVLGFLVFDLAAENGSLSSSDLRRLGRYRQHVIHALAKARLVGDLTTANRAKDAFLANMSHELRTPLNSIIGFSEVLIAKLGDDLPIRYRKFLNNILGSAEHLLSLINDILDLSKVEAGRMHYELDTVNVAEIVESVCRLMQGVVTERRIRLRQEVAAELPAVVLDGGKLKQILFNLVSNAIKFSPDDTEVVISARLVATADGSPPDSLVLTVTDQGIGIKPEDRARIFEEFTQLDDGVNRQCEGTGLGLALVTRFVERHGGSIEVESTVGEGSSFKILLPRDASRHITTGSS